MIVGTDDDNNDGKELGKPDGALEIITVGILDGSKDGNVEGVVLGI